MVFRDESGKAIFKPTVGVDKPPVEDEIKKTSSTSGSRIVNPIRYPVKYLESKGITPEVIEEAKKAPSYVVDKIDYAKDVVESKPVPPPSSDVVEPDFSQTRAEYEKKQDIQTFDKNEGIQKTFFDPSQKFAEATDPYSKALQETEDVKYRGLASLSSIIYFQRDDWRQKEKDYSLVSQNLYMGGLKAHEEWHPDTKVVLTGSGYETRFPYEGAEFYGTYKKQLDKGGFGGLLATSFTGDDPLGLTSTYYTATGQYQKAIDTKIKAMVSVKKVGDVWKDKPWSRESLLASGGWFMSMPTTQVASAALIGGGISIGVGSVKAALPTIGKITEIGMGIGFGALAVKEAAPIVSASMMTGDYGDLVKFGTILGLTIPAAIAGYKKGHAFGYGRTEAYLYMKHTYKAGSPEYIRFKEGLKVARTLEYVKSHKMKPLDVAKDIIRMDKTSSKEFISFLKSHPKTVIGGSAASYPQVEGARVPRDLDLFVKGGKKDVSLAKSWFKRTKTSRGEHLVDIHGREMYKPGQYHEFGFISKKGVTGAIYDNFSTVKAKFMKANEQLFRKAVSSIKAETRYRHGTHPGFSSKNTIKAPKDIADFVILSKSLIKSAKLKTLTRWKGFKAEHHLDIFLHPKKSPSFGRSDSIFSSFVKRITKKPTHPESLFSSRGSSYSIYPSYGYPSILTPIAFGGYYTPKTSNISKISYPSYPSIIKPNSFHIKPPKYNKEIKTSYPSIKPSIVSYPKGSIKTNYVPSYTSPYIPTPVDSIVRHPYYEEYKYDGKAVTNFKYLLDSEKRKVKKLKNIDIIGTGYRHRKWKVPSSEDFLNMKIPDFDKMMKGGI